MYRLRGSVNPKLWLYRQGLYCVICKVMPLVYELNIDNSKIYLVISIQYFIRYHSREDPFQCRSKESGLLEYADSISSDSEIDRAIYEIERVVDHHDTCRDREYLVYWKGYTAKDDIWKPS